MKYDDLTYICSTIANLSGIPIRIYKEEKLQYMQSFVSFPKDPIDLYLKEIFNLKENLTYYLSPEFHYYGIVNSKEYTVVIGPSRHIEESDQELSDLAFKLQIGFEEINDFKTAMRGIVHMPAQSVLQMLCTLNFVLNNEKKELTDIGISESQQKDFDKYGEERHIDKIEKQNVSDLDQTTTYNVEQLLLNIVRKGDTVSLKNWLSKAPAVRGGIVAKDSIRQLKNLFIITTSLVARAAIQGGMPINDAFALSDEYIQYAEIENSTSKLTNLQYHMLVDYTQRVEQLRIGKSPSRLSIDVANYVQHHMSEVITVEKIAESLFMSRSHLSRKFKEETGESVSDFISKEKTSEAKRLLLYSNKSLSSIALYLGFSSPGHFSRVFKKYTGISPSAYKDKHQIV